MPRCAAWVRLLATVMPLALALGSTAEAQTSSVQRGESLVRRHCGGCHAVSTTGPSRLPGAPPLRELHRRYEPEMLAEALAEGILTGHPAMPAFRFGPRDIRSIILYLDEIQDRKTSACGSDCRPGIGRGD